MLSHPRGAHCRVEPWTSGTSRHSVAPVEPDTIGPSRYPQIEPSGWRCVRKARVIKLRSRLDDGVVVDHGIRAGRDEVDFRVVATNPGQIASQAHWAQPCIRVDRYAGTKLERNSETYLRHCFIDVDGEPATAPHGPFGPRRSTRRAKCGAPRASTATTSTHGR